MANRSFNDVMLMSNTIKHIFLRIEVRTYNKSTSYTTAGINFGDWTVDDFISLKQSDIDSSSSINLNSTQSVTRTLTLKIKNSADPLTLKGINNWGADFQSNRQKWWLDKRLAVFIRVQLSADLNSTEYYEMPMGVFIMTGFSSDHSISNYPITTIQASSGEVLFSSRRGKFYKNITIDKGTSLIDAIKRILIQGGEKPDNILISPNVIGETDTIIPTPWEIKRTYYKDDYVKIYNSYTKETNYYKCTLTHVSDVNNNPETGINKDLFWILDNSIFVPQENNYRSVIDISKDNFEKMQSPMTFIEEDRTSFRTKYSSVRFSISDANLYNGSLPRRLITYDFDEEQDFSGFNSIAFYARSNVDLNDGIFQIWFYDRNSNVPYKMNIGELVGNMERTRISTVNGATHVQSEERENWRMIIVPIGLVNNLKNIYKFDIVMAKKVREYGYNFFNLWIDDIIVAKISNLADNPLNYTISQNRWQAVKELSEKLMCNAYYTRDGYFLLDKKHLQDPLTYINNIREYLEKYFGPYNMNPNISSGDFNLIESATTFQFEPFYSFLDWLSYTPDRALASRVLRISTNNLYNYNLVQPNTYYGDFVIYLDKITPENRKNRIIEHCQYYFPNLFTKELKIGIGNILRADLIELLYFNNQHKDGQYNYKQLDYLFDRTNSLLMSRDEFSAVFNIEKEGNYQVPQDDVSIYYTDLTEDWRTLKDKKDTMYGGGSSTFDEGELSNHIIAYGGSNNDPVTGVAEGKLTEDGLKLRVKGKYINERGRVRGINQMDTAAWFPNEIYSPTTAPTWLSNSYYFPETYVKALDETTQAYEYFKCIQVHQSTEMNNPIYGINKDSYWKKEEPGYLLNKDTNIDRLYFGCYNIDTVKELLGQDRFRELTERPVKNFTVERIGDYIYHHNNGDTDSLLKYTWELMNRVIFELKNRLAYSNKFSFLSKPYYGIDVYDVIEIHDRLLDIINKRFLIETISIPLNGNAMSITASAEYKPNLGIPEFDQSHKFRFGPYFYGVSYLQNNEWYGKRNIFSTDFYKPKYSLTGIPFDTTEEENTYTKAPGYSYNDIERQKKILGGEIDYWTSEGAMIYGAGSLVKVKINSTFNGKDYVVYRCKKTHLATESRKPVYNEVNEYWDLWTSSWITGEPCGLTYDFYDISFYEGEKSLEVGYPVAPITNGEVSFSFMSGSEINLIEPKTYKVTNGKIDFSNSGKYNKKSTSIEINKTKLLTLNNTSEEKNIETVSSPLVFSAPSIEGYELDQLINTVSYDVTNSPSEFNYTFNYKESVTGTIVVKHIWIKNGESIEIAEQNLYNNVSSHVVEAINSNNWVILSDQKTLTININEQDEIIEYAFYYEPIPDWVITNNFHGLNINPVILNEESIPLVNINNQFYMKNYNNCIYILNNTINIIGQPETFLRYVIYGIEEDYINSLTSIAVRANDFGHFFTPEQLTAIKHYEQKYPFIELEKVTNICYFDFSKSESKEIFN